MKHGVVSEIFSLKHADMYIGLHTQPHAECTSTDNKEYRYIKLAAGISVCERRHVHRFFIVTFNATAVFASLRAYISNDF